MVNFAAFPPEVTSARMYSGAGSGPLLATASAWDQLAAELHAAATSYRAAVSELTDGPWLGPASRSMSAAAAPYALWMTTTAAQAEQTASQARSAAAAYETAFAATVPPPVIAANRASLASLVATNILGQNTSAIAATEAHYAEMWAQDAAAMYGYAGNSTMATTLTPFTSPTENTNSGGAASQAAAATQAAASSTGVGAQSSMAQALSTVPNLLNQLSAGSSSASGSNLLLSLLDNPAIQGFNTLSNELSGAVGTSYGGNFLASGILLTAVPMLAVLFNPLAAALQGGAAIDVSDVGLGSALAGSYDSGLGGAGAAAALGEATSVGGLSVPASWGTAPPIQLAATELPFTAPGGVVPAGTVEPAGFYGGMPAMGPVGSIVNAPRGDQNRLRTGKHPSVIAALPGESTGNASSQYRPAASNRTAPSGNGGVSERDELDALRQAIADAAKQRDVLKRTAAFLIKEAAQE
ncbi:PPE family protein [Mycobacterium sp.]|uniref:PPE family protein n=1 Tax=Mycobacterium sp. TaxID=1785 RepID=UPI0031D09B8E